MTRHLSPEDLYSYQKTAIQHILDHPNAMLWLDMGLGKTVIAETAVNTLAYDTFDVHAALVVAPVRVIQTVWRQESNVWSHLSHLKFSLVHGTPGERRAALRRKADIYLINYENLDWLTGEVEHFWLKRGKYPPFDMLILDESTKVKNPNATRSKRLLKLRPYFRRVIGLTGEPAANGYIDLFGQYLQIDAGVRLGRSVTTYKDAFFVPAGFGNYKYRLTPLGKQSIQERIHDITLEMSAKDYLDLPPVVENDIYVNLPGPLQQQYDSLEADFFTELDSGREIEVFNAASKGTKCLQYANGALYYDEHGHWEAVHSLKLDALTDLVEEQGGSPILLAYSFRHDAERIKERFPHAEHLSSSLGYREIDRLVDRWNRGDVPLMIGHPLSMGHGLNLQFGGSTLCWFGLNYSLDLYDQFNARLAGGHRRQGRVMLHRILASNTLDVAVLDALKTKAGTQADLKAAINAYRQRRIAA